MQARTPPAASILSTGPVHTAAGTLRLCPGTLPGDPGPVRVPTATGVGSAVFTKRRQARQSRASAPLLSVALCCLEERVRRSGADSVPLGKGLGGIRKRDETRKVLL